MTHQPPPPPPPGAVDEPFGEAVDRRSGRAGDAFRVPFSVADAFVALLIYFLGQLVVGVAVGLVLAFVSGEVEGNDTALLIATVVSQVVGLLLALGYLGLRRRLSWRLLGPVRPGFVQVLLGLAVGVVGTILAYAVNAAITVLFDLEAPVEQQLLQDVLAGGVTTAFVVLAAVVFAPLAEEVLFRGLLFQSLRRRLGLWFAALTSSLVFCLVHVEIITSQPLALTGLFVLAVVFAWSFHRTGSLVVPILAHATFNAVSLGLAILAEQLPLALAFPPSVWLPAP